MGEEATSNSNSSTPSNSSNSNDDNSNPYPSSRPKQTRMAEGAMQQQMEKGQQFDVDVAVLPIIQSKNVSTLQMYATYAIAKGTNATCVTIWQPSKQIGAKEDCQCSHRMQQPESRRRHKQQGTHQHHDTKHKSQQKHQPNQPRQPEYLHLRTLHHYKRDGCVRLLLVGLLSGAMVHDALGVEPTS